MTSTETSIKIEFNFDVEKFADVMAFFASGVHDLTTLKALKLIYLADRAHLLEYGAPILGDWYAHMDHGPVPSKAYDLLKQFTDPDPSYHFDEVEILEAHVGKAKKGKHVRFTKRQKIELHALSESELKILKSTVSSYGKRKAFELAEMTHKHFAWIRCEESRGHVLDYRDFFADSDENEVMKEVMEIEQENRDFISKINA